jgi:hypothetical protein
LLDSIEYNTHFQKKLFESATYLLGLRTFG